MLVELHAIQSFGPSNLNRDDTGNPKEALFGGVRRARISSQSAKRAMRISDVFAQSIQVPTGTRTKALVDEIAARLIAHDLPEDYGRQAATEVVEASFAKPDKKNANKTNVLVYISSGEIDLLVDQILEAYQAGTTVDTKLLQKELGKHFKGRTLAPDIALFGRMLAEHPDLNIDAACQVAHAISTHEVNSAEFDYFTAVDDLMPGDESGAGMLGLVAFNSATYYRCARIDWEQLVTNLNGDVELARSTVIAIMHAFALVVPTGMKNSFVNQHTPDFLLAVARPNNDGQSLVNAFEQPVRARQGSGYAETSVKVLAKYWEQIEQAFRLTDPVVSVLNPRNYDLPSEELTTAQQPNLQNWIDMIITSLPGEQS